MPYVSQADAGVKTLLNVCVSLALIQSVNSLIWIVVLNRDSPLHSTRGGSRDHSEQWINNPSRRKRDP